MIFLNNAVLELLHQINFISILFMNIISLNIPKIKIICFPEYPLNNVLHFPPYFRSTDLQGNSKLWLI